MPNYFFKPPLDLQKQSNKYIYIVQWYKQFCELKIMFLSEIKKADR